MAGVLAPKLRRDASAPPDADDDLNPIPIENFKKFLGFFSMDKGLFLKILHLILLFYNYLTKRIVGKGWLHLLSI